jgi:cytochrome b subunit of formate dehydrogenase
MSKEHEHHRFSLAQRIEHALLILSFTTLVVTGIPQKYAGTAIGEGVIALLGGIETTRVIHHVAAIVFALETLYHVVVVLYKITVRRLALTMLPGPKDVVDAFDSIRFNLGLKKTPPRMPRYNFAEKVEYWAMIWGAVIMGITGFMLWNPVFTARLLPGQVIPAAKAAHGAEAVLAALAIVIWHFYSVHIKSFNKSMFTGKLSMHQMHEEHGAELEAPDHRPDPDPETLRRRQRIFIPIASVVAIALAVGLIWFATFETTAIATVPRGTTPVVVPLTSDASGGSPSDQGPVTPGIPHPVEGREDCVACHAEGGLASIPANHKGRPVESCQICHRPLEGDGASGAAAGIIHPIEGRERCSLCHGDLASLRPLPVSHEGRQDDSCTLCHGLAEASTLRVTNLPVGAPHPVTGASFADCATCHGVDKPLGLPEGHASYVTGDCSTCHQPLAVVTASSSAVPAAIPHSIEGPVYADCTTCHGADGMKPAPEDHVNFTVANCFVCHQQTTDIEAPYPPATPHDLSVAAYADCTLCHAAGRVKPAPENHAGYTVDICTTCHVPTSAGEESTAAAPPATTTEPQSAAGGAQQSTAATPRATPHDLSDPAFSSCTACHSTGVIKPAPEDHLSYPVSSCTGCHQPASS